MTKVIRFPIENINNRFISKEIQSALDKLDVKSKNKAEEIIESTCKDYDCVFNTMQLSLSANVTEKDIAVIKEVFLRQQNTIKELLESLIAQRIINELY